MNAEKIKLAATLLCSHILRETVKDDAYEALHNMMCDDKIDIREYCQIRDKILEMSEDMLNENIRFNTIEEIIRYAKADAKTPDDKHLLRVYEQLLK